MRTGCFWLSTTTSTMKNTKGYIDDFHHNWRFFTQNVGLIIFTKSRSLLLFLLAQQNYVTEKKCPSFLVLAQSIRPNLALAILCAIWL
jgi:hypothetical protein